MADAVQFMKEKITNTFVIKDQKFLTPKSWRKAWSEWGARDTELSEISAKIMHHSVGTRNKFYLNNVEMPRKRLAEVGHKMLKRMKNVEGTESIDGDERDDITEAGPSTSNVEDVQNVDMEEQYVTVAGWSRMHEENIQNEDMEEEETVAVKKIDLS